MVYLNVRAITMNHLDMIRTRALRGYNFLKEGTCSHPEHNSVSEPFFNQRVAIHGAMGCDAYGINKFLDFLPLPHELETLFKLIGRTDVEYYWDNWTLFSTQHMEERVLLYRKHGQYNVIDFAHISMGMGHAIVAAIDPIDRKIFFRRDGGSNGYDREKNWNAILNYKPEDTDKHEFSRWFELVEGKVPAWDIAMTLCI